MKKVTIECGMIMYGDSDTGFTTDSMMDILKLGNMGYTKVYDQYDSYNPLDCTEEQ